MESDIIAVRLLSLAGRSTLLLFLGSIILEFMKILFQFLVERFIAKYIRNARCRGSCYGGQCH